eukprot:CAMPEP_0202746654 /NCGR_PEP_ID=MMETSP1388-20130828/8315_1 /ASSEMBLY_ACC=CAM_ASM_000864 /TAXON_ID=37098 /ORGANISM="Isochrysis sp, Strain CCMP1244" /LENGTH=302 /DNA_ID=CAMNT_0049413925 /DNA_START=74 /DNA_END=981 /DNA_ORIENTATION=-
MCAYRLSYVQLTSRLLAAQPAARHSRAESSPRRGRADSPLPCLLAAAEEGAGDAASHAPREAGQVRRVGDGKALARLEAPVLAEHHRDDGQQPEQQPEPLANHLLLARAAPQQVEPAPHAEAQVEAEEREHARRAAEGRLRRGGVEELRHAGAEPRRREPARAPVDVPLELEHASARVERGGDVAAEEDGGHAARAEPPRERQCGEEEREQVAVAMVGVEVGEGGGEERPPARRQLGADEREVVQERGRGERKHRPGRIMLSSARRREGGDRCKGDCEGATTLASTRERLRQPTAAMRLKAW